MNSSLTEKEKARQKIIEAVFEYAGLCHVENIIEQMEEEYKSGEQIPFPDELDTRMRQLIASYNKRANFNKYKRNARKVLSKAAAIFIIIIATASIFYMSVEAIRLRVLNLVMDQTKEYTSIEVKEEPDVKKDSSAVIPPNWEGLYAPTYIPEGFMVKKADNHRHTNIIIYSNEAGQTIMFEQHSDEKKLRVDTEDAKTNKIMVNDFEGLLVEKDGKFSVIWQNNDISFAVIGKIDVNELLKIAESVEIVK